MTHPAPRGYRLRNALQTLVLLTGMAALLGLLGRLLYGPEGMLWSLVPTGLLLALSPRVTPALLMRLCGAQPLTPAQAPGLFEAVAQLARQAELPRPPALYLVPSQVMNAFTVGTPGRAAIAVTAGLLRGLDARQVIAVLAHEISHIANRDLVVMGLADLLSRLTALLSNIGVVLVFLNLPLAMLGLATINWSAVVLLLAAPTMGTLLQLALSRAREYDADATAAALTHDPEGLAQALLRLERQQGSWVEQLLLGRRMPDPSLLRTHPPTAERIRRLQAIARDLPTGRPIAPWPTPYVPGPPTLPPPRRHLSGLWY